MIKGKKLEKGNTIGIVSPSSPSYNKSEIVRGKETLEALGYKVVLSKNLNKIKGLVAASEEERADDINEMFRRDDIDAVFVS
ncbi:MAG: LD-carboxypeptidase, partial [Eubacteriales bacterium]